MDDLQKSDTMLLTNHAYLQYKDLKQNDMLFQKHFSQTLPRCLKAIDRETEFRLLRSMKIPQCTPAITSRGGNTGREPLRPCPSIYSSYSLNEFLLVPCPTPTYKNFLVMDGDKVCTKSHQMLNNWTKRKWGVNEDTQS